MKGIPFPCKRGFLFFLRIKSSILCFSPHPSDMNKVYENTWLTANPYVQTYSRIISVELCKTLIGKGGIQCNEMGMPCALFHLPPMDEVHHVFLQLYQMSDCFDQIIMMYINTQLNIILDNGSLDTYAKILIKFQ